LNIPKKSGPTTVPFVEYFIQKWYKVWKWMWLAEFLWARSARLVSFI
jgi:hypothetical protein